MLGRVQRDLAGIQSRLCRHAGSANAIANIARCRCTEDGLANFAGIVAHAALRNDRHVAGVEIRPKDGGDALGRCCSTARRQRVPLAIGVDIEGTVFLNNPAVVLRGESSVCYTVDQRYMKIAGLREDKRSCRLTARGSLRVLRCKRQAVRARGCSGGKAAIRVHRNRSTR